MPLTTPDQRYIVVKERLWRASNPALPENQRSELVEALMAGRRAVREALATGDERALRLARTAVNDAKVALGERGPPWWNDGAPDLNRHLVKNTPYAEWWQAQSAGNG